MNKSLSGLFRSVTNTASRVVNALRFAAPLVTRLVVGVTFVYTGRGKLSNLERTAAFFAGLGIPFPAANALFVSTLELVGGACLMAGIGTRVVAALLSSTMVVALLTADKGDIISKFPADVTDVTSAVLLMFLAWLVLYGPGTLSIDALVGGMLRRRKVTAAFNATPATVQSTVQ